MKKKGWIRESIKEVKGAFAVHILMNPLRYLCRTLLGARGIALIVLGLQYMDAVNLRNGMAVYMIGAFAAALCGAVDAVFKAKAECGIRLRQKQELLRVVLYRKNGGRDSSVERPDGAEAYGRAEQSHGAGTWDRAESSHGAAAYGRAEQSHGAGTWDRAESSHGAAVQDSTEPPHNGKPLHSAKLQEILITDVENIVGFFGTQISNFVTPVAVSLICIAAVFTKSGIIALIVLFSMFLTAVINLYFLPKLHAQIREVREAENGLTSRYTDTILGSAVIRVFSCQKYYLEQIGRNIQSVLNTQTKEIKIRFMQGLALNLLAFSSMTVPFLAGAILTVKGRMDLSTMIYITQISGNLLWFINTFSSTVTEMQKTRISRERIESVLAQGGNWQGTYKLVPAKDQGQHGAYKSMPAKDRDQQGVYRIDAYKRVGDAGAVSMSGQEKTDTGSSGCPAIVSGNDCAVKLEHMNVSLGGRQILKDISLEIPRGACVAFVGESGCGKTTIFKALQDFVPYQGRISLFGRDADSLEEETRYGLMSLVSQDVGLTGGTIYENILIGNQKASRKEVEEAVGMAQVDGFVASLEAGLDTEIGENGSMLSGGERQRVALARGFLKDAPILMLDEVTSALDPATEESIVSAVERLRGRQTILMIAQKLNTIRSADRIFCIRDGEIAGQGTHEELMENCEEYRRLVFSAARGGQGIKNTAV